ncbi:hypothetical protein IFM46972_06616 [Aspergillus udagawae]|uniref:Uncharacterized protein n=1 Tax=Aspergillus udagawae TaxID=91492 RepID=A0A8H3RVP4_9EURO|nr:hypothetical protein IFM46972_06616 [Aspergillus udagawae]
MLGSPRSAVGFPARNVERISGEAPSKDMGKAALLGARAFSGLTILVTPTIHAKPAPLFYPSLHGKTRKAAEKNAHTISLFDPREYLCRKLYHNTELDALPDCLSVV